MNLTGKAKEDFEKWYLETECEDLELLWQFKEEFRLFYNVLTPSMQYGVYVDWFDSVGIDVPTDKKGYSCFYMEYRGNLQQFNTRPEARTAAIEKANQIFNNQDKLKWRQVN